MGVMRDGAVDGKKAEANTRLAGEGKRAEVREASKGKAFEDGWLCAVL